MSSDGLVLDWCSYAAARWAVRSWYYRDEMPIGKLVKIGVWEDSVFSGVVIFGLSASNALGRRWQLGTFECCELSRLALRPDHRVQVSRVVRIALLMLRRQSPGVRAVVSFADPTHHYGGVYQAGGWIYTGTSIPDKRYTDVAGRVWHSREVSSTGRKRILGSVVTVPRPQDCIVEKIPGKHRYVMPLDAEVRARVLVTAQPAPHAPKA